MIVLFETSIFFVCAVVVATDDEDKYLEHCRSFLKDPKNEDCKAVFASNELTIKSAMVASSGDTKAAFEKLLEIYGKSK